MNVLLPQTLSDLDSWVSAHEQGCPGLREDNQARIRWGDMAGKRTRVAFVFLHGFSASPRELSPFPERLADAFGANLYLPRLTGHGRNEADSMAEASVGAWQRDARVAYEIGARLGERVVMIGSSTGATLAAWVAAQDWCRQLAAMIWVSPNFGVTDRRAFLLGMPGARRWLPWLLGAERRVLPESAAHEQYWTLSYPLSAVVSMHELVQQVAHHCARAQRVPLLAMYCEQDQVVAATRTEQFLAQLPESQWERVLLPAMAKGSNHVLLGDAAGDPEITQQALAASIDFLQRRLSLAEQEV